MSLSFRAQALAAIAEEATGIVARGVLQPLQIERKSDRSQVTAVDLAVNDFLRRELTALVPTSGWLSEETDDDRSRIGKPWVWIVDPIDGTDQLVSGVPEIAISFGLVDAGGTVVAAAIVNPATGERGTWTQGEEPAFAGLRAVPHAASLDDAEAIVSLSESRDGELADLGGIVGRSRPVGSAAYKLLRVAAGADSLTYSLRPKSEWDICAGVGLIRAAGLAYLRLDGRSIIFNQTDTRIPSGAVAGPLRLAEALRHRINERRPERRA